MSRSPSLRRLMREASELSSSPSPHFHAGPVSDSNLYDWHFTLSGPPSPSPYAGGIYHGRIVLPATYPLRPPSFRFLTPSGRFEVNREICLSISGHHEESWQPAWGIRTSLTAIRSFMDGEAAGQVGGLDGVSDQIKREWAEQSRTWCCDVCSKGSTDGKPKSNGDLLDEWRAYCVEVGVDVGKEEEVEGVPEGLRIGVKKGKEAEGKTEPETEVKVSTSESAAPPGPTSTELDANPTAPTESTTKTADNTSSVRRGPILQSPATTIQQPLSAAVSTSLSSPATAPSGSAPQRRLLQQPQPTPTRTIAATQPPPVSQDSAWLDRAIFGVLVALVLMILRRVVNVED
ncbi:ubiquitin-conjugating enzyme/RWD-like protein [Aspergillus californicus]